MPNLRPFRDYDEHDVINLFTLTDKNTALSSDGSKVNKGTLVQINTTDEANGWMNTTEAIGSMGNAGTAVGGTVSLRYGVQAKVEPCQSGQEMLKQILILEQEILLLKQIFMVMNLILTD